MDIFESLNSVLVDLFNDILNIEERALITEEFKDISVTDMHIIEAIGIEEPRTMSTISKSLGVTMGTLTVGINGLVKKGYVIRKRGEKDRRIVYASLTDKGIEPITKLVDSDAQTAVDTIKAVVKAGQEYNSFLGK